MPTGFGWDFKTQYQKSQWEDMEYRGRPFAEAIYDKVNSQIARITFNRPQRRNALNDGMFNDFLAGLHQANDDPEVRVVIIRGNGPNFGSGHDLSSPPGEESPPVNPSLNPTMLDYYGLERRRCGKHEDFLNYPKITVAQVHGAAVGASEMIGLLADITIAAEDAQLGVRGFGRFPFGPSWWSGWWPAESDKIYGGHLLPEVSGREAAEMGIITKAVPLAELEKEVMKWAEAMCRLSPEVMVVAKEWLNGMLDVTGIGASWRSHYAEHLMLQYVRFHPDEVNMYKSKRDKGGVKGFLGQRESSSTAQKTGSD